MVRDAEKSEQSAPQSIQDSLKKVNVPTPTLAGKVGQGTPTVCLLLLPGGNKPGMIKSLLCQTLQSEKVY